MKTLVRMGVLTLLLASLAIPASAQLGDWSNAGSTGTVNAASLGTYDTIGTSLLFRAGVDGRVVARYPVTNTFGSAVSLIPPWKIFLLAYADSGPGASVFAQLVRIDICTRIPKVICEIKSDDGGSCKRCELAEPLDFGNYVYYVEITLQENGPLDFAAAHHTTIY
jgi:hypothetical protein